MGKLCYINYSGKYIEINFNENSIYMIEFIFVFVFVFSLP